MLRECVAPVLLVSRQKWKKGSAIMATVDLEATAKAKQALNVDVITSARHYAEMLQVDLSVLCVIDVPTLLFSAYLNYPFFPPSEPLRRHVLQYGGC